MWLNIGNIPANNKMISQLKISSMYSKLDNADVKLGNSNLEQEFSQLLIPFVAELIEQKNYSIAAQKICTFYLLNFKQDRNRRLQKQCDSWLALLLEKQGKYHKALEFYRAIAQQSNVNDTFYLINKISLIKVLHKAGNSEAAIKESEAILEQNSDRLSLELINLLEQYVQILDDCGLNFSLKYSFIVEKISHKLGLDISTYNLQASSDLSQIIKDIALQNNQAHKRYSATIMAVNNLNQSSAAISLLEKYIAEEEFQFYRHLAQENLKEIKLNI